MSGCGGNVDDDAASDVVEQEVEPAAEVGAVERGFRYRAESALEQHTGELVIEEETLVTELWQFHDTLELLGDWGASIAVRSQNGEALFAKAYLNSVSTVEKRASVFFPFARKGLGKDLEYYTAQYNIIENDLQQILVQAAAIANADGDKKRAQKFMESASKNEGIAPGSIPSLAQAFEGEYPDDVRQARDMEKTNVADSMDKTIARAKLQKTETFVSPDRSIQSLLEKGNVSDEQSIIPFLRAFLAQYHSGRLERLKPFFPEVWFPEERLLALAKQWEGWEFEDMGVLVSVRQYDEKKYELYLPSVLMKSEEGGLREIPINIQIRKEESGRYKVVSLSSKNQLRRQSMEFVEKLEEEMRKFYYEQTLERRRNQSQEAEAS